VCLIAWCLCLVVWFTSQHAEDEEEDEEQEQKQNMLLRLKRAYLGINSAALGFLHMSQEGQGEEDQARCRT